MNGCRLLRAFLVTDRVSPGGWESVLVFIVALGVCVLVMCKGFKCVKS